MKTPTALLKIKKLGGRRGLLLSMCVLGLIFVGARQKERVPSERGFAPRAGFQKFVDELPIPPRIIVARGTTELSIDIGQVAHEFHSFFGPSVAWGYNGSSPGPTIEVEAQQVLRVHWKNRLPSQHIFAAPVGAMACGAPEVKTVTHLHGAFVPQTSVVDRVNNNDGWPDLWIINGEEQISEYTNPQDARTLWYHDHAIGDTGRNVATGLSGLYIIHDDFERSLNLPSGKFEIPLLLQTQGMNADGTRYYTPEAPLEFYGNVSSVNGKLYPFLVVEPRKYRFRIVNGANARSFSLKILDFQSQEPGPEFYQIGSDAGFLEKTVILNQPGSENSPRLLLTPAERADVIIDFSKFAGRELVLHNNYLDPGDGQIPLPTLMLIRVADSSTAPDTSQLPLNIRKIARLNPLTSVRTRQVVLGQKLLPSGQNMLVLNNATWTDPITERPKLGTTEVWELINTLPDAHPFHIHSVQFQVLDRQEFAVDTYMQTGKVVPIGERIPPEENERGWKDVVRAPPNILTRIIVPFGPFPGKFIYHCHILEHEDMDMMRPFEIQE